MRSQTGCRRQLAVREALSGGVELALFKPATIDFDIPAKA